MALATWVLTGCTDDAFNPDTPPNVALDAYVGEYDLVTLKESMQNFRQAEFVCELSAENGELIRREGHHTRIGGLSELRFNVGLRPGAYRLRCLLTPEVDDATKDTTWVEYGLGCLIQLGANADSTVVEEPYDQKMGLYGEGTKECPYKIACADNLKALRNVTNDAETNALLTPSTYFLQTNDIDLYRASKKANRELGWIPIGNLSNCPFRGIYDGNGFLLDKLWINRPIFSENACVGLFGFAEQATFKQVTLQQAQVTGCLGAGGVLGCAMSAGDRRSKVALIDNVVKSSNIATSTDGFAAGGLVGMVDCRADILLERCANEETDVSGDYGVGGLLGAGGKSSRTILNQCTNSGKVTARYTGAGGIAGAVDSLMAVYCHNSGAVNGAQAYANAQQPDDVGCLGSGGIVGGSGTGYAVACSNKASVAGHTGVGGIIGSTRILRDEDSKGNVKNGLVFNDISVQACSNEGSISGFTSVGGLVGEAQLECHTVYNIGTVKATYRNGHVGGIAGNASVAVLFNALNKGTVSGTVGSAGGVIGKATWGNIYGCQNMAEVSNEGRYVGGIIGLAGNYTVVDYCTNTGSVKGINATSAGGLIGEIGDAHKWSADDIALCVIGAVDVALGVASPIISCGGEVLHGSTDFKYLSKFFHVLHISESILDGGLIAYDIGKSLAWDTFIMLTEEESSAEQAEMKALVNGQSQKVKEEIKKLREQFNPSGLPGSPLSSEPLTAYWEHLQTVCQALDDLQLAKNVNYHMNEVRDERLEVLQHRERKKEIVHKVVAGVCVLVSGITLVISAAGVVPSGGATAPLVAVIGGAFPSIIGGANAIIESTEHYTQNVVVVSQCVNTGTLDTRGTQHVGGLIGYAHQNCSFSNCLNAGKHTTTSGDQGGGVMSHASSACEVSNCLNVGNGWSHPIVASTGKSTRFQHNYYFTTEQGGNTMEQGSNEENGAAPSGQGLILQELCKPSNYTNWDIHTAQSLWTLTEWDSYYPAPWNSAMQRDFKE